MIETRICGIPCLIRVTRFDYQKPNPKADNPMDFNGGYDIEYEVCDRNGREAPWLEQKMSAAEEDKIMQEIIENYGEQSDY